MLGFLSRRLAQEHLRACFTAICQYAPYSQASRSGTKRSKAKAGMRIAVEGCCHGELDAIYATMQQLERQQGKKIDLLICCGDFQAARNLDDLECLACPPKYRHLRTFYKYYSGEAIAPYPTLFIGGNHEASNYLWELYYGGWAAPNIFYMGHAGVVNIGGVRIGGLSGTYQPHNYRKGHFEGPPYTDGTMRSAYHLRELEVFRMLQIQQPLDIMLTHDWPDGIAYHGNIQQLVQQKKHLRAEIERGELGSKPGKQLMEELKPRYWFAAHYHIKFPALVRHPQPSSPSGKIADGNDLAEQFTKFLSLDKCLPGRKFLQVIEFPEARGPVQLHYDEEWLSILHSTHHLLSLQRFPKPLPGTGGLRTGPSSDSRDHVRRALEQCGGASIPSNFVRTAPPHDAHRPQRGKMPQEELRNPQTETFLERLGLPYNLDHGSTATRTTPTPAEEPNPEEINLDDTDEVEEAAEDGCLDFAADSGLNNPEEISLDEEILLDEEEQLDKPSNGEG